MQYKQSYALLSLDAYLNKEQNIKTKMKYNTQLKKLSMPDYGRNIQNMVNHCLTIEDREERKKCANTVVDIMGNMFPHLRDVNDFKHILWDHLAIMSDFKLDIDYPYEVITEEDLYTRPGKMEYSKGKMRFKHYGKLLEKMIDIAADMEEGGKRDQLISQIAVQMKRSYTQWNKDIDDAKIIDDLRDFSKGKINLDPNTFTISSIKVSANAPTSKRKNVRIVRSKRNNKR